MIKRWYRSNITQRTQLGAFLRKWRRFVYGNFLPHKIEEKIKNSRSGECHRCGLCCGLLYQCPFLGRDAQNLPYCRVYGDLRPANCRVYPFDAIDSEVDGCGFRFDQEEIKK